MDINLLATTNQINIIFLMYFYKNQRKIPLFLYFQDSVVVGIPITNPTNEDLQLDVQLIDSTVLTGERCLVLEPGGQLHYEVKYSPAVTGDSEGR